MHTGKHSYSRILDKIHAPKPLLPYFEVGLILVAKAKFDGHAHAKVGLGCKWIIKLKPLSFKGLPL